MPCLVIGGTFSIRRKGLFVYLSIYICLSVCLSVYLSIYLSSRLSFCLTFYPSIRLSMHQFYLYWSTVDLGHFAVAQSCPRNYAYKTVQGRNCRHSRNMRDLSAPVVTRSATHAACHMTAFCSQHESFSGVNHDGAPCWGLMVRAFWHKICPFCSGSLKFQDQINGRCSVSVRGPIYTVDVQF